VEEHALALTQQLTTQALKQAIEAIHRGILNFSYPGNFLLNQHLTDPNRGQLPP
jgi:hypothetical protein